MPTLRSTNTEVGGNPAAPVCDGCGQCCHRFSCLLSSHTQIDSRHRRKDQHENIQYKKYASTRLYIYTTSTGFIQHLVPVSCTPSMSQRRLRVRPYLVDAKLRHTAGHACSTSSSTFHIPQLPFQAAPYRPPRILYVPCIIHPTFHNSHSSSSTIRARDYREGL